MHLHSELFQFINASSCLDVLSVTSLSVGKIPSLYMCEGGNLGSVMGTCGEVGWVGMHIELVREFVND